MDFVHEKLATDGKIRALAVVNIYSRFVPPIDSRFSYRADNVVETLEQIRGPVGHRTTKIVDQGCGFAPRDMPP